MSDNRGSAPHLPEAFSPDRLQDYLEGTQGAPARDLLVRALDARPEGDAGSVGPAALDIGCGPGREVVLLLGRGFAVTAIDPYPRMIDLTAEAIRAADAGWLRRSRLLVCTLEQIASDLPARGFDVVHAGFVLPFVPSAAFPACFEALQRSLRKNGLLVAQFFGPEDQFVREARPGTMTAHTATELDAMLEPFEVLHREEVRRDGRIGRGKPKFWHVHHVIARWRDQ